MPQTTQDGESRKIGSELVKVTDLNQLSYRTKRIFVPFSLSISLFSALSLSKNGNKEVKSGGNKSRGKDTKFA